MVCGRPATDPRETREKHATFLQRDDSGGILKFVHFGDITSEREAKKPCSGYALAENRKDLFGGLAGKANNGDSTAGVQKKELHRMTLDNIKAE